MFGSNLAGRHGKGAALDALKYHGAIYGQGFGEQGRSYGIPTKDANICTLPLDTIRQYVNLFLEEARNSPEKTYRLTPIGCGLAGYTPESIAPLFDNYPPNVLLPKEFIEVEKSNRSESSPSSI